MRNTTTQECTCGTQQFFVDIDQENNTLILTCASCEDKRTIKIR